MTKGLFITATGTDIGKTYVTALIVKKLREAGLDAGYYKAALSGAEDVAHSDAGYVNKTARIGEPEDMLLSYLYKNAYSPHLAARLEGNPVDMETVRRDFARVCGRYDYVTVEGSGGIICPIRHDGGAVIYLEDIIRAFGLASVIVADAGLGTINAAVLTERYMKSRGLKTRGFILNHYGGTVMERDNIKMIEELTELPVLALVRDDAPELEMAPAALETLYGEVSL